MCGIVGLFPKDSTEKPEASLLWEMLAPLQNRGPDGQKVFAQDGIGMGHARLSIIDLDSRSDQPMKDLETGYLLTFNGEIYNYLELRAELTMLGHLFFTSGDTEVILKAYQQWGVDCLQRFNGMWSFALYDPNQQTLFCARDRMGVKPFVFSSVENTLVFASEAKALISAFPQLRHPNIPFLKHFLAVGDFAGLAETFYEDIYNLLPGHYFLIQHGEKPQQKRYWNFQPEILSSQQGKTPKGEEVLEEFGALLTDSIRLRFRSDVPVGACLSGGMDSSSIVALASTFLEGKVSTFSCIYPEMPQLDESSYIRDIVKTFGCDAHFTSPTYPNFLETMLQSIWEQDGPTGGPSVLSQRAVMALAKGNVTVLLDGQGGDEVLGGYHSYFRWRQQEQFRKVLTTGSPRALIEFIQARNAIQQRTGKQFLPSLKNLYKASKKPVVFGRKRYSASALDEISPPPQEDLLARQTEDLLLTMSNLLHYEDRNSMAFSLESRLPFLDYRLVEMMFSLPSDLKIQGSRTKHLLYETVKNILPASVVNRKDKMGFETPGQVWFRNPKAAAYLNQYLQYCPPELKPLPTEFMYALESSWANCQKGVPIPVGLECSLWRYFTACMWLEMQKQQIPMSAFLTSKSILPVYSSHN
ncbi:MAG: asparagine synthase (glutamine-hydrolyzing) [Cyanobacteria bacterium]|nr:asparagine synthase (glutamine-hydrolyzing) [Cyanobacteriota bacterium]